MAGYSGTPLPKKLGIKENFRIGLVKPPKSFVPQLGQLPSNTKILSRLTSPLDLIVVIRRSRNNTDWAVSSVSQRSFQRTE